MDKNALNNCEGSRQSVFEGQGRVAAGEEQLILPTVNSAEDTVADGIRNVEVVTVHQGPIVMVYVVFSQATDERQSTGPRPWIHVINEM